MDDNLERIAEALRRIMTEGGEGNFAIMTADERRNYYIQFASECGSTSLFGEAVSNESLTTGNALGPRQEQRLEELSWLPPEDNCTNYHREWTEDHDDGVRALAGTVMQTFREVYGIPPEQPIEIELNLDELDS
ncbi:MAG: hypothetical protein HY815_20880 [Candidatus Riflebacteria bacterium]|nr:hypothetical protein [Candidatus Riflebacteria bacterium]